MFSASGLGEPGRRHGLGEYHRGLSLFRGGKILRPIPHKLHQRIYLGLRKEIDGNERIP